MCGKKYNFVVENHESKMLYTLTSSLHHEDLPEALVPDEAFVKSHQVVAVLTGGTESLFLQLVRQGQITMSEPVYLVVTQQSNSLAAALEILAWINQHDGQGEVLTPRG